MDEARPTLLSVNVDPDDVTWTGGYQTSKPPCVSTLPRAASEKTTCMVDLPGDVDVCACFERIRFGGMVTAGHLP